MSFNVVVTDGFKKHAKSIAKKHRSLKSDLDKLIDSLQDNPTQGELLEKTVTRFAWLLPVKEKASPVAPV
jgi:mRNA-degrading endonuclease YafQ of YafQ-DinJ toxin-antitoxin module